MDNTIDLLEKNKELIKCQNCIFNDGCEKMFSECPSNFIENQYTMEMDHFKYCEVDEWNKLNEDQQKEFMTKVLEIHEKYSDVESNVK